VGNNIDIADLPNVTLIPGVEPDCNNQKVAAPPAPEPEPYDWHAYMLDSLGISQSAYDSTVAYLSDSLCVTYLELDSLLKGQYSARIIKKMIACRSDSSNGELLRTGAHPAYQSTYESSIHPVPTTDWVELSMSSPIQTLCVVKLYDHLGKLIQSFSGSYKLTEGKNDFRLNCSILSAGCYRLVVSTGSYVQHHNLVVVR
jgi:hypothetical protein